ncbi:putative disease resistance RPP13-like protein 1 [Typha latifolia]|uniref:putative disease resistance RPP13-like protein 1 n=1 Tax=Typha latifolia TaxID=4733 RepID=UPI003C2C8C91
MAAGILSSIAWMIQKLEIPLQTLNSASSSTSLFDPCRSIQEDANKLKALLPKIEAILVNAEERAYKDERVSSWLWELKGVGYDAEDVLDVLESEMLHSNLEVTAQSQVTFSSRQEEVCSSITSLACRLEAIRDRFVTLYQLKDILQLKEVARENRLPSITQVACNSGEDSIIVYGREDDKRNIIEQLLSERPEDPSVISIVGDAGVGKTTLVKTVYNDARVCAHFSYRAWVQMSKDFDIEDLWKEILEYISSASWSHDESSNLHETLKCWLTEKRYMIVLDDFSDENNTWVNDCVSLSTVLGSKIVVVTHSESVAQAIEAPYYHLNHLSQKIGWQLFQHSVFESQEPTMHPSILTFAKKVVEQCKGLPLSLKMVGSLLCSETNIDRWKSISQSQLWETNQIDDEIPPAVKLSYFGLPPQLQQCIAYCSLFPEKYLYRKDQLVRSWMAQGYINPIEGKQVEDVGSDYFQELLRRSFFLESHFGQQTYVIHHLVYEFVQSISVREFSKIEDGNLCSVRKESRHVSLITPNTRTTIEFQSSGETLPLRSFLTIIRSLNPTVKSYYWDNNHLHVSSLDNIFLHFKSLRMIDLSDTDIKDLPESIGSLINLCFLGLNRTNIVKFPKSFHRLHNLQTLELLDCHFLRELPQDITYLTRLRHINLGNRYHFILLPRGIGKLVDLQNLSLFCIGGDAEHYVLRELKNLVNLRGSLRIPGLHYVGNIEDAKFADLMNKEHIEELTLEWSDNYDYCRIEGFENVSDQLSIDFDIEGGNEDLGEKVIEEDEITFNCPSDEESSEDLWIFKINTVDEPVRISRTREERILRKKKIQELQEGVQENLRPHVNLRKLVIKSYLGTKFGSWMVSPLFSKLASLTLACCSNCEVLPPLGQLPFLRHLTLESLTNVKRVGHEFCSQEDMAYKAFPSLERLEFHSMYVWEEWCGVEDGEFPRLRELQLESCSKLRAVPYLPPLQKLELHYCWKLAAIPTLPSLTTLSVRSCETLYSSLSPDHQKLLNGK